VGPGGAAAVVRAEEEAPAGDRQGAEL
jgi:hypothetical protein